MEAPSLIFDIKRFAIHDGPGIRITIFLKGCPLSCVWCHNPEGQSKSVQKMYTESKCIGSQECISVCDHDALALTPNGIVTDVYKCTLCGDCAKACPTKAIEMSGEPLSAEQIMQYITRESVIMDQSEGGVTFSGGEPLLHHHFLIELLDACGEQGIHRCVDTSGFASTNVLLEVAKRTDLFLYDLKMMDSEKHEKYTGVPNEKILKNLKELCATDAKVWIRIPLIHGINDGEDNIRKTAAFISSLHGEKKPVHLLPYHNIAVNKLEKLGENEDVDVYDTPSDKKQKEIIEMFGEYGVSAVVGG